MRGPEPHYREDLDAIEGIIAALLGVDSRAKMKGEARSIRI